MKKRISFYTWISVFIGGIWQFLRSIFSRNNKGGFWRVVWMAIAICLIAITSMLGYAFYDEYYVLKQERAAWYEKSNLGDHYYFYDKGRNKGKSYICEVNSGKKILESLDWIARPEDGDSLIVFARDGKRGYFNRYTGEVAIPAVYDAAWCFNDGVAGVCEGDSVFFINHRGKPINSRKFAREKNRNYTYYGQYFIYTDNGKLGLIDRKGDIAVPAVYDDIIPMSRKMWDVKKDGRYGVINDSGEMVITCEYKGISIFPEGGIVTLLDDNTKKRLDYDGTVIDDFVYDCVRQLQYDTDIFNDEGERVPASAENMVYSVGNYQGLMNGAGQPLCLPLYSDIEAVTAKMYSCRIAGTNEKILLDARGKKIIK